MAKQLNVDVNLNTAQAEAKLKNLQNLLSQAITSSSKSSAGGLTQEIVQATKAASELKVMLGQAMNPNTGNLDLSRFSQQLSKSKTSLNDYAKSLTKLGPQGQQAFMSLSKSIVSAEVPMRDTSKMLNEFGTTLKNTMRWQATSSLIHNLVGGIQSAMSYARGLDSSLNSIRIVTGLSADEMSKFAKSANESAKALSASTLDYTDAALIYYQQGIRDQKQIKDRTDATIKMANVTGDSAAKVSNQLTAIWNNFAKGGDNLEYYADVITALGAATASSSAEISAGLEKFASIAEETGLSYEYATSSLATIVATTRQSADVVGTALKTIFGRVQSLNLGETLEDGTTLGKYSKALSQVGIDIKDQNGQLKDMDNILDEMGAKWQGLNRDQRVALAQSVAGARQYNQLMALMENYDFFKENVAIAKGSEGELTKQAEIYAESWDAAKTRVRAAAQGIFDDLISDKFFIGFNDGLATALGGIDKFINALGGIPGTLGLIGSIVTKVFSQQIGQSIERGIQSFKVFTGVARVEANSVREQAITAAKTFTPGETAPKSMQMESSSLQQQLVLANQYQQKIEAIAKAGGQVAASDKQRIASLMQIVELTQEAAIAAQQQVEAGQQAQNQANNNIMRNAMSKKMKDLEKEGVSADEARRQARIYAQEKMTSLGLQREVLTDAKFTQGGLARLGAGNYNLAAPQIAGLQNYLARNIRASGDARSNALKSGNLVAADLWTQQQKQQTMVLDNILKSGKFKDTAQKYMTAQKNREKYKGTDSKIISQLDGEVNQFRAALEKMASAIKEAVGDVTEQISEAEALALQDMANESESSQNNFLDSIDKHVEAATQASDMEDQGNAYIQELSDEIDSLNAESFSGFTQGISSAMMGVSNLAMGISSLQSGIQALNDDSLSFGEKLLQVSMSFGMAIPMITSGIGSLAAGIGKVGKEGAALISSGLLANTAAGFGQSSGFLGALASGGAAGGAAFAGQKGMLKKSIGGILAQRRFDKIAKKALKDYGGNAAQAGWAAEQLYNNNDKLNRGTKLAEGTGAKRAEQLAAKQAGQAPVKGLPSGLQIAAIVAALAALAVLISKIKKEIHEASLEGQLEKAVEEGNSLSSALDEAKSSAEGLKSAFDSYHGIADSLSKCTTGTQEWTEALRANNNEVISLMSQYPELAKIQGAIQKNADGSLSISEEAEEQMNKIAQDRVDTLSWAKLANTELQQSLQDQMDLKTRSREMMNMQIAGQDRSYYNKDTDWRTEVRTSDFDTDMVGGFSYINGGDGASLDAAERQQLRQSKGPGQLTEVSANQKANELLLENWGELQALSGESLTQALGKVMTEGGLKITGEDLAKYSAGVESAAYRAEMTKMYNQQKAQQDAFETQQIGLINNKLASEGILENDSKTRDLISTLFGKQLDERTKEAVAEDKEAYNRGGQERIDLAEEYVRAMGGDTNSISWNGNEFSYLDSAGQKIEGITSAMVASVTGAASALDALAGSAEAAASAMQAIPQTEEGEAIRDYIKNGDLTKTSGKNLKALLGDQLGADRLAPTLLAESLMSAVGGGKNADAIAEALGVTTEEFLGDLGKAVAEENEWYRSTARKAAMAQIHATTGADQERLEDYSRAELEARQRYENSKMDRGPVKTLQELQTAAEAAGEAQQYLNNSWKDGTRLTAEQMDGLRNIISDTEQYGLVIDESTGKVRDASLLNDMLNNSIKSVGKDAALAQATLYEQMGNLFDELIDISNSDAFSAGSQERQANILKEIELLQQEISKYDELIVAQSGAAQAYAKIAEGKEYDEAHDYTDELQGALGSIYSHIEKDSKGNYDWSTLEVGSKEAQAALEALLPKDILTGTNREGITPEQYIKAMYGDGERAGRYRDKSGNIAKANIDNFVNDALGKASAWGDYTGFASNIDFKTGQIDFIDSTGEIETNGGKKSLADAASSMHMSEAAFLSMVTAMDKYNEGKTSFLSQFSIEGAEFATQLQKNAQDIVDAGEKLQEVLSDPNSKPEERTAALQAQKDALLEEQRIRKEGIEDAIKYQSLVDQRDAILSDGVISTDENNALDDILAQIAEIEGKGGIELKLNLITDESAIENIQTQLQSAFDGNEFNYDALGVDQWTEILSQIQNMDNPFEGWKESGLDKILTDTENLPNNLSKALSGLGKDKSWITELNNGVKEALSGEDGENDIDLSVSDESISAINDAITEIVEKERKLNVSLPDDVKEYLDGDGPTGKYGGANSPTHEGSTTGGSSGRRQPKQQQQQQVQSQTATVTIDVVGAEKITEVTNAIASIPSTIPLSISGNLYEVQDSIATLSGLLNTLGGAVPVLTINTNEAQVTGELDRVGSAAKKLSSIKPRITISSNASAVLGSVTALGNALRRIKSPPPIHISITADPVPSIPGIAFGNARAYGNAFESGKWGTGKGPMSALVGELGQELVVDPATGKFYTVGNAGAEFVQLPKNAIVFNHKQTEELLKYRKINSRGQAMVNGNAYASGDNVEDVRNIIADLFERDSSLTTYRSTAAAAAEKERAEYEQKLVTILRDEVDLYATIERTIKRTERHLESFTRNLDRLYGESLVTNYKKAIEESRKLYDVNLKARDIASDIYKNDLKRGSNLTVQWQEKAAASYSTADKPAYNTNLATQNWSAFDLLTTYGNLDPNGITRGANGEVLDIDPTLVDLAIKTIQRRAEDNWNLSQDESKTQADRVAAENAANWFDGIVKSLSTWYQQVMESEDKVAEFNDAAQDALEQAHDYAVELIRKEFEMRTRIQDNELKRIELKIKRLGDGFFKTAERMAWAFNKENALDLTKNTVFTDNVIKSDAAIKEWQDAKTLLANANKDDRQAYAATQAAFMETTQEAFDELANDIDAMLEAVEKQMNAWGEALEDSRNVLNNYTDQLAHVTTMLSHIEDILDLTGQKYNYDMKDQVLKSSVQSINNEIGAETKYYEILKKNREEAEAHWLETKKNSSEEAAQLEYEKYVLPAIQAEQESLEKKTELYKDALSKIEEIWSNSLAQIMSNWEEAITNEEGFDWLSESMSRAKAIQDQYLTTTNKIYETNTLMRKVQNDIDKTSSKISKEKLANFNKEIEAAQNSEKLSKNSMEILKARYELLQAELALEEAKDAKSVVRLQRDSEGNYGYVYTADQDDIDDAEQNLADKQNDLYNLVLGIQNDSQELRLQVQQEYHAAAQQLYDDFYNKHLMSQEEYDAKLAELKRQAEEKLLAIDGDITESAFWLNEVAAEGVSEAWTNSYDTRIAKTDEFMDCFNDSSDQVTDVLATIDALREETSQRADVDLNNLTTDIETLTTTSNLLSQEIEGNVIPAIENELDAVQDETEAFWDQYDAIMAVIDARSKMLNEMSYDMKVVSGEYANDAYAPDWSVEMMKAAAAGDWEAYNKALANRTTKIELGGGFDASKHRMTAAESDAAIRGYAAQGMTVEQMTAAYQKDSAAMHPEINVTVNVDKTGHGKIKYNGTHYADGHVEGERVEEWATGGYTGEWGSEGKLAILHEKELVLNKDDTSNFLRALEVAKEGYMQTIQMQQLQEAYQQQMLASAEWLRSTNFQNNTETLQQEVTIHAEFPNVSSHSEIEEAFSNLVNRASQYANRDGWAKSYNNRLLSSM